MVICDEWLSYKEDNMDNAQFVKETSLNDNWWMEVNYILAFVALFMMLSEKQIQI